MPNPELCLDFALAEFSSAIEMLYASKKIKNDRLAVGFLKHCIDEYRHTNFFKKLLREGVVDSTEQLFQFNPVLVYQKGFINEQKFLFDKMSLDEFSVFIGVNEMQALKIFKRFKIKSWNFQPEIEVELDNIIQEENRHAINSDEIFFDAFSEILTDEERHSNLALSFAKRNIKMVKYKFLYFKYLFFNKLRHFAANSKLAKKILSYLVTFLLILFTYPFRFALSTNSISNEFHLNKKNANLIL